MKSTLASPLEFAASLILAAVCILMLCSCTDVTVATRTKADGSTTKVAHIGSALTRSKARVLKITMPDGTVLEASGDNDETVAPRMSMMGGLIGKGIDAVPGVANAFKK